MKKRRWIRAVGFFLAGGVWISPVWADETIEMSTYIPAPGASGNPFDRLHTSRATVGNAYSLTNPPDPPAAGALTDGTLLVSQRLGIGMGAALPGGRLHIVGNSTTINLIAQAGTGQTATSLAEFRDTAGTTLVRINPAGGTFIQPNDPAVVPLELRGVTGQTADLFQVRSVSASPFLVVKSSGNVGIGTANPQERFHLAGPVSTRFLLDNGVIISQKNVAGTVRNLVTHYSDNKVYLDNPDGDLVLRTGNNNYLETLVLDAAGNGVLRGTLTQLSDGRDKTAVVPIPDALTRVCALQGINFHWKRQGSAEELQMGLIGQEVEKVFPELVATNSEGKKSVAYANLTAVLIEAVKELKEKNEALERRVAELEAIRYE